MQSNGSGVFAYLFLAFFGIQAICIFYHHFISNIECWSYRELQQFKKEMAAVNEMKKNMGKGNDGYDSSDDSRS
ncbi:hypothetical protein, partial [Acinetobacter baumannii]|uniref:hypothetical protein n=1 Tax=Acinetobacter baumannii TaxID=470 RepID=UPI0011781045